MAMEFLLKPIPARDGKGVYLVTKDGARLIVGTEARRVREVPSTQP
jgi:hypothetical protein